MIACKAVKISDEMLKKLEKVKNTYKTPQKSYTAEEDAIILEYYCKKDKVELAKIIGVSPSTMRRRYRELIKNAEN